MFNAVKYFLTSWSYLFHPAVKRYFLLSALVSVLLFIVLTWGITGGSNILAQWLSQWIPWDWSGESVLYQWILRILSLVLLFGIYKYIVLVILGPIMSLMSEKLEIALSPQKKERKSPGMMYGMLRGIRLNFFNLLKEMSLTVILFFLSFIPGLAIITTPSIFLVQGYYAGYGILDFYLERYTDYPTSNRVVFRYKWFTIVTGMMFVLIFAIPLIGMILAPVIGVISSTLFFEKEKIFE